MEDSELLALYLQRSEEAIAKTGEKYGRLLFSIADRILKNREDAEECENETYLRAWNAIPPKEPDPFFPYLGKIARNLALQRYEYYTAQKRSAQLTEIFGELEECAADLESVESRFSAQELGRAISAFLRGADREARLLFVRRYWYADSVKELAARFGFSESKVKTSLFRTRNRLKLYLEKEGFSL